MCRRIVNLTRLKGESRHVIRKESVYVLFSEERGKKGLSGGVVPCRRLNDRRGSSVGVTQGAVRTRVQNTFLHSSTGGLGTLRPRKHKVSEKRRKKREGRTEGPVH